MLNPFSLAMLAIESQKVVELRLAKLAWGGPEAFNEAHRMIAEKIDASIEAGRTLLFGGSVETVVDRYREHVAANTERLGPPSAR